MIKIDLHIHSVASTYKESNDIVIDSTIENVDVLLSKLNEYEVGLFSITDHNRFYTDLYKEIDNRLHSKSNPFKKVLNVLSGVEFDVQIDPEMSKCHIITIFDSENKVSNYEKIEMEIGKNKLEGSGAYYSKSEFEQLLTNIGLNTILIACQRKDINNHNGNHNSLSDSSNDVNEIISVGYVNALEYQKPKVEGILRNNLKALPMPLGLVTGSDCHTWSCYPNHDCINKYESFFHSKVKILPTFKGVLMAITSPKTRINNRENSNTSFFKGISSDGGEILFTNGVNAIIGENGAGKSSLLKFINGETKEPFIKEIVKKNNLALINNLEKSEVNYIKQGDIIDKFNKKILFSSSTENNFKEIDHNPFNSMYTLFSDKIKGRIEQNIKEKQSIEKLSTIKIVYNGDLDVSNYYIHVTCPSKFDEIENEHEKPRNDIKEILDRLQIIKHNVYFESFSKDIDVALDSMTKIYDHIYAKWEMINIESKVKNVIQGSITEYDIKINGESSARDREKKDYRENRQKFIDTIISAISICNCEHHEILEPKEIGGMSKNTKRGFCFNKEAKYNKVSMIDEYFIQMFTKEYQNLELLKEIDTIEEFVSAIKNCTTHTTIQIKWKENLEKFIKEASNEKEYITDGFENKIGNTLGEMSLSYLKYSTKENDDWEIFIIDQPEDNISNNNINKHLIEYINSIRDTKQIILVTHNPLLVVNLDVDNVVYIENNNNMLNTKCGCLEYEIDSINILELIANNMDGGKESIEKRLKVYGN